MIKIKFKVLEDFKNATSGILVSNFQPVKQKYQSKKRKK